MNKLLSSFRIFQEIKFVCLCLVLVSIPFSGRIPIFVIIALFLFATLTMYKRKERFIFYKDMSFYIPSTIVIVSIFGLLYTSNLKTGIGVIERLTSLLFLPFIFFQFGVSQEEFDKLRKCFIGTLFVTILILEIRVFWLIVYRGHSFAQDFFSYDYTYENITTSFLAQPIYIGSFIVLSNIFCLSLFAAQTERKKHFVYIIILAVNNFFLFQLSARSSLLLNVIIISCFISYIFFTKKKLILGAVVIGGLLVLSASLFVFSGFTRMRVQFVLSEFRSDDPQKIDPQSRMLIWPCAVEVIKENSIIGVGTGDAESMLIEQYKKNGLDELYDSKLNAHNEYLTLIMRHGLLGVAVILICVVFPLYIFWKKRNMEALLFMCLMAGFFVTENVLSRVQGVVFFAFFQSIFLVITSNNEQNENTSLRY